MTEEEICPHCGYSASQDNGAHQLKVGTVLHGQYEVGRVWDEKFA